ncbi:MAG TPA: hypothetical protein VG819_05845 [Rhizomicrobium sp.]|jgi:hypothetical protein|nr:hypothetical protein [Rhizomicrobium sp.]
MNRYLMMTAATILAGAAPAMAADRAKMHSIHFLTIGGGSYCDGMSFQKVGRHQAAGLHLNEDCAGKNGQVAGTVDKTQYSFSENYTGTISLTYDIFKPIRNGGKWDLWVCFNGSSCFEGNSGIYSKGFPAAGASRLRTTARVRQMIAEHRNAKR